MKLPIRVALCLAFALSIGTTAAAASASPAALTQPEYQQLTVLFGRLKAVKGATVGVFKKRESICRRAIGVTALVSDEKASCLGVAKQQIAAVDLVSISKRCDTRTSAVQQLNCLTPGFRAFYRSLENEYRALQRLERVDRTRAFSSGCVAILGGAPQGVANYGRIVRDAGNVLSEIRSHNITRLRTAEDRLFAAENNGTTVTTSAKYSLSTCLQAR
jgi:hypothetical protein